jgi:O-antigen/teichoic acid export membrane protein
LGRSYLTLVVCQAIAAAAALAALRWLATYVDPETFGSYSLYQSVIAAGALFLVSWPNAALLRFGREEWMRDGHVGATVGARLVLFVGSISVALALAWVFDPYLQRLLHVDGSPFIWIAVGLVVCPAADMAIYVNQAIGRTEVYGYSPAITRLGFFAGVALIPFVHVRSGWTYLAAWFLAATCVAALVVLLTMPRGSWKGFAFRWPMVTMLIRYSWTLPFAAISTYVVNWIDSWVIREFRGIASVGVYNWAYQTTAIASLAFAPLAVALTPRVIDARLNGDSEWLNRYVSSILPAATFLAIAESFGFMFVFPAFNLIASPSYTSAYPVILILLSALPFQLISYLVTPLASAYERLLPRFVLVSAGIACLNVVGDIILVPRLGIPGAALATTTAFALGAVILIRVVRAEGIRFAPLWHYTLPAVIVLPSAAIVYSTGPRIGGILVGAGALGLGLVFARTYRGHLLVLKSALHL